MRLQFLVEVEIHPLSKDLQDLVRVHGERAVTASITEAIEGELKFAEGNGFYHPLAEDVSIEIVSVTPKA